MFISALSAVEIAEDPPPVLAPRETLVSLRVAAVCGSDLYGMHPTMNPPYYTAREVVGVVLEIGAEVTGIVVGQLVTPEPPVPCGKCKMRRSPRTNLCETLEFFGCRFREGGMADIFSIRADRLHVIPDGFGLRQAALIEPGATPVHAVRLAGNLTGKAVAIIRCGTISLLVLAVARADGARKIVMTDVLEAKRPCALARGADAMVDATDPNLAEVVSPKLCETADTILDCVSIQQTVAAGIDMVQCAGSIIINGVLSWPVEILVFLLQDRHIRIQGAATYLSENSAESIRLIASGGVDGHTVVTSSFLLEMAVEAFATAACGEHIKVPDTGGGVILEQTARSEGQCLAVGQTRRRRR